MTSGGPTGVQNPGLQTSTVELVIARDENNRDAGREFGEPVDTGHHAFSQDVPGAYQNVDVVRQLFEWPSEFQVKIGNDPDSHSSIPCRAYPPQQLGGTALSASRAVDPNSIGVLQLTQVLFGEKRMARQVSNRERPPHFHGKRVVR